MFLCGNIKCYHTITGKMIARNVDLRTQRTAKHTICTSVNRWTLLSGTWRRYGKSGWCFDGIIISLILSQNYKRQCLIRYGGQKWKICNYLLTHIISNPNGAFHLIKVNEDKACPAPKGNNKLIHFTKLFSCNDMIWIHGFALQNGSISMIGMRWFDLNDLFSNQIDLVLDWLRDLTWLQFFWREDYQWITMYILIFSSHKTFRWL